MQFVEGHIFFSLVQTIALHECGICDSVRRLRPCSTRIRCSRPHSVTLPMCASPVDWTTSFRYTGQRERQIQEANGAKREVSRETGECIRQAQLEKGERVAERVSDVVGDYLTHHHAYCSVCVCVCDFLVHIYIYIYVYVCVCVCVCDFLVYIYIYMCVCVCLFVCLFVCV
jgi:hypothetical protein